MANVLATLEAGEYTDPGSRGLQLRVRGTARTWLYRYTWRGQWVRLTIGRFPGVSLAAARDKAQELRRQLGAGIDPRRAGPRRRAPAPSSPTSLEPDSHSIETLAAEFLEKHIEPHRKRPEYVRAILRRDVLPVWAGRDARTIKPREVVELLDGIVARGSRVQANRTAAVLGQMFKFAIHRAIVETTPVLLLYRPGGKEKARDRVLSDAELRIYLADPLACTRFPRLSHVMALLLLTGQRRGELALARWSDVNLKAKNWHVPAENSKTGKPHVVPLTGWAITEFRALKAEGEGSVFVLPSVPGGDSPLDAKQLTRSLAKCIGRFKKNGIAKFTLHDLRRTCRTGLAKLKVQPHIAERVLNHVQEKIPGTYDVHDYADEKREALEKWAAHLRGLQP